MSEMGRQFGDYRILQAIGEGGMARVYLAEHVHLRTNYAVKILPEELAGDENFVARFHDEARVMSELRHPNIVMVHAMSSQDGTYFLAMDYVTGPEGKPQSLRDTLRLRPDGRTPQDKIQAWAVQIASVLAYAHGRGVVHRDIKPGNLLLDAQGNVRLTDFGLAKAVGNEFLLSQVHQSMQESLSMRKTVASAGSDGDTLSRADTAGGSKPATSAGGILGTYDYMAPEQRGEITGPIDRRTDIYAFGVLLYRLLTGVRPVGMAKPPSQAVAGLSPRWDSITARCLERNPADRYPSADELLADLRAERVGKEPRPRRKIWIAAGIAALVAVAVVVIGLGFVGRVSRRAMVPARVERMKATVGKQVRPVMTTAKKEIKRGAKAAWETTKKEARKSGRRVMNAAVDNLERKVTELTSQPQNQPGPAPSAPKPIPRSERAPQDRRVAEALLARGIEEYGAGRLRSAKNILSRVQAGSLSESSRRELTYYQGQVDLEIRKEVEAGRPQPESRKSDDE